MPPPVPPPEPTLSLTARAMEAIGGVRSRQPPSEPSDLGFLDSITEEEEKVLAKHWPEAKPSGDGVEHLDERMQIRTDRMKWRARIATGSEIVWLGGKAAALVVVFAFAWGHLVS